MKNAEIIPTFKNNDKYQINNYRPLSLLTGTCIIIDFEGKSPNQHLFLDLFKAFDTIDQKYILLDKFNSYLSDIMQCVKIVDLLFSDEITYYIVALL